MEKQNEFEISFYIIRNDPFNNKINKCIELFKFNYFRSIGDSSVKLQMEKEFLKFTIV